MIKMVENDEYLREVAKKMKEIFKDSKELMIMLNEEMALMDIAQVRHEGKAEGIIEIAKNLLKLGFNEPTISEATGLQLPQIQNLKLEIS